MLACRRSFFQVDIAQKLVNVAGIEQEGVAILSPYNAQVSEIRESLKKKSLGRVTVTTIMKSQGDSAHPPGLCGPVASRHSATLYFYHDATKSDGNVEDPVWDHDPAQTGSR